MIRLVNFLGDPLIIRLFIHSFILTEIYIAPLQDWPLLKTTPDRINYYNLFNSNSVKLHTRYSLSESYRMSTDVGGAI